MNINKWLLIIFIILSFVITGCQLKRQSFFDKEYKQHIDKVTISAISEDPRKQETMTKLSEYLFDFDDDGKEEALVLYTSAERNSKGEMLWDDGNKWLLVMRDGDKFYTLLSEYVQLGQVYFSVLAAYEDKKIPQISVYIPTSSNIRLLNYRFDSTTGNFVKEVLYDSKVINEVFTSIPSY